MLKNSITNSKIKKTITVSFLAAALLTRTIPIYADDTPPTAPTAPLTPSSPSQPSQQTTNPTTQTQNPPSSQPTSTPSQTQPAQISSSSTTQQNVKDMTPEQKQAAEQQYFQQQNQPSTSPTATPNTSPTSTANQTIQTSPTPSTSALTASNSTNSSPSHDPANIANGAGSNNNASEQNANNNTTNQNNTGTAANNLNLSTVTGQNTASLNVGNSNLQTGDANISGTAMTFMNTNLNAIAVNEFNMADNHTGDIVLNFGGANCISGCGLDAPNVVKNVVNGAGSNNNAVSNQTSNNTTSQNNDATVGNTLTLNADSGHNAASDNTGGNSTIQTGNANVEANSMTLANNNVDGRIVYSTVNIYGDLNGDIVMPQSAMDAVLVVNGSSAANIGNGTGASNSASTNQNNNDATFQSNDANIANNLQLSSTTGNNSTNNDTSGNANIQTGQNTTDSKILNVANSNIDGGNVWLVIINQVGNWIGKILGAPDGATTASGGLTLSTDNNGNVTASNNGNGAGSSNNASASNNSNSSSSQTNKADITNTLKLTANTGGNNANDNTGETSSITTGSAHIIANMVNFVNNNIKNGGKLFVTIVNIFGKWTGNFVPPGQKDDHPVQQQIAASNQSVQTPTPTPAIVQSDQTAMINAANTSNPILADYQTGYYDLNIRYRYPYPNNYANTQGRVIAVLPDYQLPVVPRTNAVAGARVEKQAVTINLAWILPFLPIFGLFPLLKRKLFHISP